MKINKETLFPSLIYNLPVKYSDKILIYPVRMEHILEFQFLSKSITLRKNSIFHNKEIIKMSYLDFLVFSLGNKEISSIYDIKELDHYFLYAVNLLQLCCPKSKIQIDFNNGTILINEELITSEKFDDLRRIIILQNNIDFDIDEFLNYDTEQKLLKAQKEIDKNDTTTIEDYIDSLAIAMHITEQQIMNMTIRKFWRFIKRYNLHETYTIIKTGECSGMVSYKEPIKHWMSSIDEDDKYKNLKADEQELRSKIS